jgi:hypothetical protein
LISAAVAAALVVAEVGTEIVVLTFENVPPGDWKAMTHHVPELECMTS